MEIQQGTSSAGGTNYRRDALASLVVFLVALPLCMAIALASGAPVASGLITGIIGGLVVGLIAGAPLQVSGPAAGLTVIVGEIIREHGLTAMGVIVMIAGALQLVAGLARLGQWFRAVSPAVIHGMLAGIGVLIVASQIHILIDDRPRENGLKNVLAIPHAIHKGASLPTWERADRRLARIAMIKRFGALHEKQFEIEAHTTRLVSQHARPAELAREGDLLTAFIEPQTRVAENLAELRKQLVSSPLLDEAAPRSAPLRAALADAELKVAAALADLKARRPLEVPESQEAASRAIAGVLASLKSHAWAAKIGLLSIAIIVLWQWLAPKRLRLIPGPLLAVAATTALAYAFSLPVLYVETPQNLLDGLNFPVLHIFQDVKLWDLLLAGFTIAAVASAETLLCASAVDRMHSGPRTQYDRELAAQGIGNMLCGLFGALPMTGVIVRSAANVHAGATSRWSAVLHGLWILLFVVFLGGLLRMIPICALAGILIHIGLRLIDYKALIHLWKTSRSEALIFVTTMVVIAAEDLLTGVITGVVLSALKLLVSFSNLDVQLKAAGGAPGHERITLKISGAATFLRLPVLAAKLDEVPTGAHLHVDFEHLDYIDHACLELLMSWARQHETTGGQLFIDWGQLHARFRAGSKSADKNNGLKRKDDAAASDKPAAPVGASAENTAL